MKSLSELRDDGYNDLEGRWGNAVILTLVYHLLYTVLSGIICSFVFISLLSSILLFPVVWGFSIAFLDNTRGTNSKPLDLSYLWNSYNDSSRVIGTYILKSIYIFLWSLLLIIPGIIKRYSYAMTPYILRDDPNISYNDAIELSMEMMDGNKWRLFLLDLSFIGWYLLALLTLGIGFLFLTPYIESTYANFYEDLKDDIPVSTTP